MNSLLKRAVPVLALVVISTAALAQASINDCEKIQAADAYNQCLAKFGPPQKAQNLEPERPNDIKSSSEDAAAGAGKAKLGHAAASRRSRGRYSRRRSGGGRKHMTINVGRRRR